MSPGKEPELRRTNSDVVLLKILGLGSTIDEFDLLDKLDEIAVFQGMNMLQQIGAVKDLANRENTNANPKNDTLLTHKGMIMAEFPTEPTLTNVILQAY